MAFVVLLALILLVLVCLSISAVIFFNFLYPMFWGAPYAPSDTKDINAMPEFAQIKPGENVADLGSGDGRAVIRMAQLGANAVGYEISPILVMWSRFKVRLLPKEIANKISFLKQNFWNVDLSVYDVIFLYQLPFVMKKLTAKLDKELKPGARVVCNGFNIKDWQANKNTDRVFLYIKSGQV